MQELYKPWGIKNEVEDLWGVEILKGTFSNTIISFNEIKFAGDDSDDLSIDYTIIKAPDSMNKEEIKGPEFESIVGKVVEDILRKAIEHYENEHRKTDTSKFDT
jgi:hypothetical protein